MSVIFEVALAIQVALYVKRNVSAAVPLTKFVRSLVDFESISFLFYLIVEVVFLVAFSLIAPTYISLLNTFYLNVPVVLFLFNILIFLRRKAKNVTGNAQQQNEFAAKMLTMGAKKEPLVFES